VKNTERTAALSQVRNERRFVNMRFQSSERGYKTAPTSTRPSPFSPRPVSGYTNNGEFELHPPAALTPTNDVHTDWKFLMNLGRLPRSIHSLRPRAESIDAYSDNSYEEIIRMSLPTLPRNVQTPITPVDSHRRGLNPDRARDLRRETRNDHCSDPTHIADSLLLHPGVGGGN
jgi:hypothetical protein